MEIQSAEFVQSSPSLALCPQDERREYAFIGRSNVGKSSLLNMLVRRKNLALTSGRPGKTQLINHFIINQNWYMVDLPGYGYAKVSKKSRRIFQEIISDYILERPNLVNLFVLIDCRHPPQKIDLEFMRWLGEEGVPFSQVFTKCDKLGLNALKKNIADYNSVMLEEWAALPPQFLSSAEDGRGRPELLAYIAKLNEDMDAAAAH